MEFEEMEAENVAENDKSHDDKKVAGKSSSISRFVSDAIKVQIIPEKKGNFIKHTEYDIRSEKYNCSVERRYNDFLCLYENLLKVYEYRAIPRLPPKQFMIDAFLEERRVGLQRWLIIVSQHAVISKDILLRNFLAESMFALPNVSSEFNNFLSQTVQSLTVNDLDVVEKRLKVSRSILNNLLALKRIINEQMKRDDNQASDFSEICQVLDELMELTHDTASLKDFRENFDQVSKISENNQNKRTGAVEQLELIIEVIISFDDACERVLNLRDTADDDKFNSQRLKNLLRGNVVSDEDSDTRRRRILFGISCVVEEFKLVENYIKLLPSILLKFTYQQSQIFSQLKNIFQNILEIESDKLN